MYFVASCIGHKIKINLQKHFVTHYFWVRFQLFCVSVTTGKSKEFLHGQGDFSQAVVRLAGDLSRWRGGEDTRVERRDGQPCL